MKKIILPFIFLFSFLTTYCQAIIRKPVSTNSSKSILDFGAIPDDGKDDTWAFIKAGKYFSNEWDINGNPLGHGIININYSINSAKLIMPTGTYHAGKQVSAPCGKALNTTYGSIFGNANNTAFNLPSSHSYLTGLTLIELKNIDQLSIEGIGKAVIKYNDNLVYGFFDCNGKPMFYDVTGMLTGSKAAINFDGTTGVGLGNFINAFDCYNVQIKNIEIDGNNKKAIYNGGYGNERIQLGSSGIVFYKSKNISIEKVNVHHMPLDGIVYGDFYNDPVAFPGQKPSNFFVENSIFDHNRR